MDDQKPSLLILKTYGSSLKLQESFLKNRDIIFTSTTSVTDAIQWISKNRPRYVLLPVDHPQRTVRNLPKVLGELFGVTTIAYCEQTSSTSIAMLAEMRLPYNLYPPLSGPAILRMIAKIEKIRYNESITKGVADLQQTPPGDDDIARAEMLLSQMIASEASAPAAAEMPRFEIEPESDYDATSEAKIIPLPVRKIVPPQSIPTKTFNAISQALQKSLAEMPLPTEPFAEQLMSERMHCVAVQCGPFTGYLVMKNNYDLPLDQATENQLRKALLATDSDLWTESTQVMDLSTRPVPFIPWANFQAEFVVDQGGKGATFAFLPTTSVTESLQGSSLASMKKVALSEIVPDLPLQFDLYIYLENNGKYVLYNKKGRTMFSSQKLRLTERGIHEVHMRSDAVQDYLKYKAENFVNASIREYNELRALKSS